MQGDSRVHDLRLDRAGSSVTLRAATPRAAPASSSRGYSPAKSRRLRDARLCDPRLNRLEGLLVSSSLVWTATPLTTAKFYSTPRSRRRTIPGASGVLTHIYTVEATTTSAAGLTGIGKFTWGTLDYQGNPRRDKIFTVSGEAIYKMSRNLWLAARLRRDWLNRICRGIARHRQW